ARGQRPYQFMAAPRRATDRNPRRLGAFHRSAARHRHISARTRSAAMGNSRCLECKDEGSVLESSVHVAALALHTFDLTPLAAFGSYNFALVHPVETQATGQEACPTPPG